ITLRLVLRVALVLYFFISEINIGIGVAERELNGTRYLRVVEELLQRVLHAKNTAIAAGPPSSRPALMRELAQVDAGLGALLEVDRDLGRALETAGHVAAWEKRWGNMKSKALEQRENGALYDDLIHTTQELAARVGDSSTLILDPDLDSYYLIDAILLRVPQNQVLLAEASLLARDAALRRRITPEARA